MTLILLTLWIHSNRVGKGRQANAPDKAGSQYDARPRVAMRCVHCDALRNCEHCANVKLNRDAEKRSNSNSNRARKA